MLWSELLRYGSEEVPDETSEPVSDVVRRIVEAHGEKVVGAEASVDAPPFSADLWWLATVRSEDSHAFVNSLEPRDAYGIDGSGRVHFAYPNELTVAAFARAIAEGHYGAADNTLVVTRAGEFGGNGHAIESLVLWLLQEFPVILLGVGVDRLVLRGDTSKRENLEQLALDWAGRHLLYPMSLKQFVDSKAAWYPSTLAQRLALDEAAARRLLGAVGYEPSAHDPALFEYADTPAAREARRQWDEAQWEPTFTSLEELLEADMDRPGRPYPQVDLEMTEKDWEPPRGRLRGRLAQVRRWIGRR